MLSESNISVFDKNALEYDFWFEKNKSIWLSEIMTVQAALELISKGTGIEIGGGTGRFSQPMGITTMVEPSYKMARIAQTRNISVIHAAAEKIPIATASYDWALWVNLICFLKNPMAALHETYRILVPDGYFILAMFDRESAYEKILEEKRATSKFFYKATFYSVGEAITLLKNAGFSVMNSWQTISSVPLLVPEPPKPGYGTGGFVVILSRKENNIL